MKHKEYTLQSLFAQWLDRKGILYCASSGGLKTTIIQAVKNKRAGYKKGYPDISIFEARGIYHGLFIELKVNTKPTQEQIWWQEELTKRGYMALIMPLNLEYGEAVDWLTGVVDKYMELK